MIRFRNIALFTFFIMYLLAGCFSSCKTVKEVTKEVTKYDSTAIREAAALKRVLSEELERFEKEKEQWESTGVIFETTPCPDSTKTMPTKIIFDNGKLKSIQGNVRSLTSDLYEKSAEAWEQKRRADSLGVELAKEKQNVKKETKVIEKKVETKVKSFPFWLLLICVIGGILLEFKFKVVKRLVNIFSIIKTIRFMKLLLFVFSICLTLASCADFHDDPGKSVWSEGLWILPWATGLGAAACLFQFYKAWRAHKGYDGRKKLSYAWLYYTAALIVATIVIIGMVIGNK